MSDFLIWVQNEFKAAETTGNQHLAQELVTKVQCSGGGQEVSQRSRELWRCGAWRPVIRSRQQPTESIAETDPPTTTWKVAQELNADHSTVVWHLKQTEKVEKLAKWVSHELTENQKNCHFEVSSSLILCNNNKPFLNQIVICDEKWTVYNNRQWLAQWLDQEEAPKHFPKPNLHPKKVIVNVWWSAAHLIHYSFLNPSKTIISQKYTQSINEIHWKLQYLQLGTDQ